MSIPSPRMVENWRRTGNHMDESWRYTQQVQPKIDLQPIVEPKFELPPIIEPKPLDLFRDRDSLDDRFPWLK